MRNLVPTYILEKYAKQEFSGCFSAYTMFIDISGFTAMTESLMKHGNVGAEELSDILKFLFTYAVDLVYENGGFITTFAGDAFTAIFRTDLTAKKDITNLRVLDTAFLINKFFEENKSYKSKYGEFEFGVKVGLSFGKVEWGILGDKNKRLTYFFRDEAVDNCAKSESYAVKGDIVIDEHFNNKCNTDIPVLNLSNGYKKLIIPKDSIKKNKISSQKNKPILSKKENERISKLFTGEKEYNFPSGEFRNVVSIFISFDESIDLERLIKSLFKNIELFGASQPKLDFGDKGGTILLFFGTPIAYENNETRALNFIWQLKKELNNEFVIRAGMSKGIVYCGFNGAELRQEFTCLGNTVNQSARFMMKAGWNEIWLSKNLASNSNYRFDLLGEYTYKGRGKKIPSYKLIGKPLDKTISFKGTFVGRDRQIVKLIKLLNPLRNNKFAGSIFIDGNAGIGKSRLTYELKLRFDTPDTSWCHLPCDDIIKSGFNPFVTFIKNIALISDENSSITNQDNYQNLLNPAISACPDKYLTKNMLLLSGYLKLILGLPSGDPEVELSNAEERYNNIMQALKIFFEIYNFDKKTIFEFDNAQFLDPDSLKLISQLIFVLQDKPAVFIFNCRLQDNGELIKFNLPTIKENRILLKPLSKNNLKILVKNNLNINKLPIETMRIIHEKSNGNPLFSEQILLFLKDNQIFDNRFRIKGNYNIPTGINQIIISRIDKLKRHLKELIKTASVLGQQFNISILAHILNDKYRNLPQLLVEGQDEDIWQSISEINYLFKYATIRDVVYDMQLKKIVKELHFLSAEAIEESYPDKIEQFYEILAYHYDKAESVDEAMKYLKLSGYQTKNKFQNKKAAEYFDKWAVYSKSKLGLIDNNWKNLELTRNNKSLLKEYAVISGIRFYLHGLVLSNIETSERIIKTMLIISKILNDDEILFIYSYDYANYLINKAEFEKATEVLDSILPKLEKQKNKEGLGIIFYNKAKIMTKTGNFAQAIKFYEESIKMTSLIKDSHKSLNLKASSLAGLGTIYDYSGDFNKALKYYMQQLKISQSIKNRSHIGLAYGNIGINYHLKQNFKDARKYYIKKMTHCEEDGNQKELSLALNNLGFLETDCKNYKKAVAYYKQSIKISELLNDNESLPNTTCNLATVLKIQKIYKDSKNYYLKALALSEKLDLLPITSEIIIELAELNWLTGNKTKAKLQLEDGLNKALACNNQEMINKAEKLKPLIYEEIL